MPEQKLFENKYSPEEWNAILTGMSDCEDPGEYYFSNPNPYAKCEPLPPDRPRHNFRFDEDGHIHVRNLSAFWIPHLCFEKEIGGTVYTVSGSYEGMETLDRKLCRIMERNMTEKRGNMEDSE